VEAAGAKTASGEPGLHQQPPRRHTARHHRPPPHQICRADRPALPAVAPPLAPCPLNLTGDSCLCDGDCKRMAVVSKILSSHPGPARRLDIRMFSTNCKVQPKFDEWFLSPALDQLEELSFEAGRCRSLPPSALRPTPTLRRASFSSCYLP
jgi:hypothetical protein